MNDFEGTKRRRRRKRPADAKSKSSSTIHAPYIKRNIGVFDVLSDEGAAIVDH